jgi:spermidine synthase
VVHVGGAAMTLPRYLVATRPRSRPLVVEPDAALVALVRERLPWPRRAGIRVREAEGRAAVRTLGDGSADVVVVDAFTGNAAPPHLTTAEAFADAARVLDAAGTYLLNVADGAPMAYARRVLAAALDTWPHVLVMADAAVLRKRRFGNLVLAASAQPLPVAALVRRTRAWAFPARVVDGDELARLAGGATPSRDADPAHPSPMPGDLWGR